MILPYGYLKGKLIAEPWLKPKPVKNEVQYHLHATVKSDGGHWDIAINVGTDDSDDLLKYKLVYDYKHDIIAQLKSAAYKFNDLTGLKGAPALDFIRSDILAGTGDWRSSDVMDGSDFPEPAASLKRLLQKAHAENADVYIFGRKYLQGGLGVHDVHMNQGSQRSFLNNGLDNHNDHNDVWQDGALLADFGQAAWAGYFTAFTQQLVPTDDLGNPQPNSRPIS